MAETTRHIADKVNIAKHRANCRAYQAGDPCRSCGHDSCGFCSDCHPEVPEW